MADFLNVDQVLAYLDIKEGMMVAEFGCGSADFSLALAKKVGKGKVYALDIQEEKLSALKSKLALKHVENVSMMLCDLEAMDGSKLKTASQDIVLIPNVLFQAENKDAIMGEAKRVLKPGGQLLLLDWLPNAPFGPKENLVSVKEAKQMATNIGFTLKREFSAGDYHFALLFIKE